MALELMLKKMLVSFFAWSVIYLYWALGRRWAVSDNRK
jgi:hypothetical protein